MRLHYAIPKIRPKSCLITYSHARILPPRFAHFKQTQLFLSHQTILHELYLRNLLTASRPWWGHLQRCFLCLEARTSSYLPLCNRPQNYTQMNNFTYLQSRKSLIVGALCRQLARRPRLCCSCRRRRLVRLQRVFLAVHVCMAFGWEAQLLALRVVTV
ncbi:uncharacterized protein GGS22DRAFT_134801 [Annulohypoxylon maeteangense]|uniref:uncharacterized protein n=1 Tax=Annulohypoxylon maeteangense TaxID=1927788 RepID=UPI0020073882|nr:uncharacterized protein GGS22DRAFT_134801 [Annulohypoxylon maeteangense]KAI0885810.1 hypothetical protein GGS22DRAFT_134801 [Annulohypoxylon maeteangense]